MSAIFSFMTSSILMGMGRGIRGFLAENSNDPKVRLEVAIGGRLVEAVSNDPAILRSLIVDARHVDSYGYSITVWGYRSPMQGNCLLLRASVRLTHPEGEQITLELFPGTGSDFGVTPVKINRAVNEDSISEVERNIRAHMDAVFP